MVQLRTWAKAPLEWAFRRSGLGSVGRAYLRNRVLILTYHNIVPGGECACGAASLHLAQRRFAEQLDLLAETHDVIPLEWVARSDSARPRSGRPCVALTFDDAYRGAVTVGVDELTRRGLPATLFVTPLYNLEQVPFSWDVADAANAVARRGVPAHAMPASMAELEMASRRPGITLASHTWSHAELVTLGSAQLDQELARPLEWLRQHFPAALPWLAYPYGQFSERVVRAVARHGYTAAVSLGAQWLSGRGRDLYALPRLNIPSGLSQNGFLFRVSSPWLPQAVAS